MKRGAVRAIPILLLGLVLSSCSQDEQSYMPLAKGHVWTYNVQYGMATAVQDVRVSRPISVEKSAGWELASPMGNSRLAWVGSRLIAEELGGVRFSPPIPIFDPLATEKKPLTWAGLVIVAGKSSEGGASLTMKPDKYKVAGRDYLVKLARIELKTTGKVVENLIWFAPGIGIVRQEQRVGDNRDRALEFLSGP